MSKPTYNQKTYKCDYCDNEEYFYKWAKTTDGVDLCNNCYRKGEEMINGLFTYDQFLFALDLADSLEKRKIAYLSMLRAVLVQRELQKENSYKSFDKDGDMKEVIMKEFINEIYSIENAIAEIMFKKVRKTATPVELSQVYDVITTKAKSLNIDLRTTEIKRVENDTFRWLYDRKPTKKY